LVVVVGTFGIRDLAADHPRVSNYVIGRARETSRGRASSGLSRFPRGSLLCAHVRHADGSAMPVRW
jgi:hypothetical protein